MLEPFIWMFNKKKFYIHFGCILIGCIICTLSSVILYNSSLFTNNLMLLNVFKILSYCVFSLLILFILGYFWNLTDVIIQRSYIIKSSNIYTGKITKVGVFDIPSISILKYIWRGIASIVATLVFLIPFTLLVIHNIHNYEMTVTFFDLNSNQADLFFNIIYIFISTFIPALAWCYAQADSVTAVMNIPKAVYLMGNYTAKYIYNSAIFIAITLLNVFLITKFINFNDVNSLSNFNNFIINYSNITYLLIFTIINIYLIYVNSYLLGTISPPGENY